MILDSERFIARERPHWRELATRLDALDASNAAATTPEAMLDLHRLYSRAASALARLRSAAAEPTTIAELESLVARAYAEIHATRRHRPAATAWQWVAHGFPTAFRRHFSAFAAVLWITLAGAVAGGALIAIDRDHRQIVIPGLFSHLHESPSERVAREEARDPGDSQAAHATFAAELMQNNIQVTINAFALGIIFGIGTALILFYNGFILGAVVFDYIADGQTVFLLGWLLPHGSVELPAIFLGGQAGFVLGRAMLGRGSRLGLRRRLRLVAADTATLVAGAAILLVWAGIIESWISQTHEPAMPYAVKIAIGLVHLAALTAWLTLGGRKKHTTPAPHPDQEAAP